MKLYTITTGVTSLLCFLVGYLAYQQDKKSLLHKKWFIFCSSVAIWSFGYFLTLTEWFSYFTSLYCSRVSHAFGAFIPILFFDFVSIQVKEKERYKKFITIGYYISAIMFICCLTPFVVKNIIPKMNIKYYPEGGVLYPVYALLYYVYAGYGIYRMYYTIRHADRITANKIKYFLVSAIIGFGGGVSLFFLILNIKIPPYSSVLIAIYPILATYGIVRYQFLDIEVVIKKTLVFAGLFTSVIAIVGVVTFILQNLLSKFIQINNWISTGISIAILIFLYDPIKNFLVNVTNKYLFQKKYDPLELLKTFSDEVLASVLDRGTIIGIGVDLLTKALNLESFAVMLINKDGDTYEIAGSYGIDDKSIEFPIASYLVTYLNKTFSHVIKGGRDKATSGELISDMEKIKAELCMPLVFHKHLVGFLAFGKRKSDKEYTNEDMNVLIPLTRDIAIAVVYAGLYEEVRQKDKLATLGTLVAGIKHEIGNPLSTILTSTQLFIRDMEEWNSLGMSQKEREDKVKDILNEVISEALRIGRITRKFTDFARPGDDGVKEILDIEKSINEALEILENELSLKHIKIEKDIPQGAPQILADKDQIHQIFFNLLRNAAQAIEMSNKPQGESKISIVVREKIGDKVTIDLSDTGCGIPEEKKVKIFEPFFTTKERGKGTGLGLAIVQQLVGKNRGDISFKSQKGEGTTFTLEFPIAKNG